MSILENKWENVQQQKKHLRTALLQQAKHLETEYLASSDAAILEKICGLPQYKQADVVFCYVSVKTEPDTHRLICRMLQEGKRVCVPRCCQGGVMDAKEISALEELAPATFGLLEPQEKAPLVAPEEVQLVILPCLSADKHGRRLGNGGGYYDRYLAGIQAPTVCLCRGRLLQENLPEEAFDQRVDCVITEEAVFANVAENH